MRIKHVVTALLLLGLPALGLADTVLDVNQDAFNGAPEPETLALLAAAVVAWGITRWKKRK
jgi:hypothetical protein